MQLPIIYGKEKKLLNIDHECEILKPADIKLESEEKILEKGFLNPLNKVSFEEFASSSDRLLIIVNDGTRSTPTAKILTYLTPILSNHPNVGFIVACGSHKKPTDKEFKFIFGECFEAIKDQVFFHDAKDKKMMKYVGKTHRGTPVYFNKKIFEYKNVVIINSVEPHYFAGYTGGRKSFLPGLAGYETIEHNHSFALSKGSCTLGLKGNPVNEDMIDSFKLIENDVNVFSIQIVLTPEGKLYKITTGDLHNSFSKAVEYANNLFCIPITKKGNIVISVASPPMDITLYQSQKALENGKLALQKNGVIILVSKCYNGVGPDEFLKLLSKSDKPEKVLDALKKEYKLGFHKSAKIAELATWADIYAVTDIKEELVKKAFMKPFKNTQDAIDAAVKKIEKNGEKIRIIFMQYGGLTVPFY
jgi:nickel-dependent lactate racemase